MKIDILPKDVTINLGHFLQAESCPIDVLVPDNISNMIQDKCLRGILYSYPIYKNDKCYRLKVNINPKQACSDYCGKKHWSGLLSNYIRPLALRLKEEFDMLEAKANSDRFPYLQGVIIDGEKFSCLHSLDNPYVDGIEIDTSRNTIELIVGS